MPEIGQALREARMRARIDVSEIEAQTKIRAKYLRALENEEWDLLPGPTFVKSFLRTYADALGLDGKGLVEEYRQSYERPNEADRSEIGQQPIVSTTSRPQGGGRRGAGRRQGGRPVAAGRGGGRGVPTPPARGYTIAIVVVSLLIVVLVVALLTGGSSTDTPTTPARSATTPRDSARHTARHTARQTPTTSAAATEVVTLSLQPTAAVYVCLLGENGRKLIPGSTLEPNPTHPTQPTYHSKHFTLTLGNASVKLYIDGSLRVVAPSSKPIGYSITKAGGRHTLPAAQQPTCK